MIQFNFEQFTVHKTFCQEVLCVNGETAKKLVNFKTLTKVTKVLKASKVSNLLIILSIKNQNQKDSKEL